jgi:DNA-binding NarL/FixJ family response regulator
LLLKGIVSKDLLKPRFDPKEVFTDRESDVLKLLCQELTNKEIAEKLFLSPRTVEGYRKNMLEKIGARNTVGLVIFAMKNNLVD